MRKIMNEYLNLNFIKNDCAAIIIRSIGDFGESYVIFDDLIKNIERITKSEKGFYAISNEIVNDIKNIFGVDLNNYIFDSFYNIVFDKNKIDFEELSLDEDTDEEIIRELLVDYIKNNSEEIESCENCEECFKESVINYYLENGYILFDGEYFTNDIDFEWEEKNLCIELNDKTILFSINDVIPIPYKIIDVYGEDEIVLKNSFLISLYVDSEGFVTIDEDKINIDEIEEKIEEMFNIYFAHKNNNDFIKILDELKKLLL